MFAGLLLIFLLIAASGYMIGLYNGLVRLRAAVKLAWSNIDVLLLQRHDELPKLVEVCRQYMQYESDTLERVMKARAGVDTARATGNVDAVGLAERDLRSGLSGLLAVVERYPDLKANDAFRQLQGRISSLETALADRREVYNDAVNANNVRVQAFPDVVLARIGSFGEAPLLRFQSDQKTDVDMKALFAR
jgi:LemA protein